jgi:hypothetical protein
MRWHCRVSHVAAHTKLLSIFTEDLLQRPMVEIEKMLTFIGGTYDRHALIADDAMLGQLLRREFNDSIFAASRDYDREVAQAAMRGIETELNATKFLTKWPCPSFRGLEQDYSRVSLSMKANELSANCSDPFVTCSVHYDQNGG